MKKVLKRIWFIVWIFVPIIVVVAIFSGAVADIGASEVHAQVPDLKVIDNTPAKLEALKDDLVARLSACESAGHSEDSGLIVFDSNAKASIGVLQWQVKSVQNVSKALYGKEVTGKEAIELALDKKQAGDLAKAVIFGNVQGGISNWANCAAKLGLPQEVAVLQKLSR